MNKIKIALAIMIVCSLSSCVTVGMNDETKARVDKALADVERISKILEEYQTDVKSLIERLNRLVDRFVPPPPTPLDKQGDKK